ncbi:hypothetical protein [Streptomyces sp. RTd22]|uniref:hypothetical protein n=1 Tax=Streptomyces sp. RTd22 TaxID=1841249 RepID=UPI0007C49727|nr:hypothetical protein [Streptomyces sp. RTd22]
MSITTLTGWATTHPGPAAAAALTALLVAVGSGWLAVRSLRRVTRPSAAVVVAAIAAAACTAYSADTSWNFARDHLGMTDATERTFMFAAAEIALLGCGLMARANMRATKTEDEAGSPGTPGVLVWLITGIQVIPAFAESGIVGGTVRAAIGPVLAAIMWHEAMGLELKIHRPGALSNGLPAIIARELRERLLSRLGLAVRDRTAEQISRDRATARVVRLASRPKLRSWGQRRLAAAVARAHVGTDPNQKHKLMRELAARRGANQLRTIDLGSPWEPEPGPAKPSTPTALARQSLTHLHPFDAIRRVHSAHPGLHPAALASLMMEHGVIVSEQMVRVAIGAGNAPAVARATVPSPPAPALEPASALALDLAPMPEVHPEVRAPARAIAADQRRSAVRVRLPECAPEPEPPEDEAPECTPPADPDAHSDAAHPHSGDDPDAHSDASGGPHSDEDDEDQDEEEPGEEDLPDPDPLLDRARELDRQHQAAKGRPASLRALQSGLHIGQIRAQHLQRLIQGD